MHSNVITADKGIANLNDFVYGRVTCEFTPGVSFDYISIINPNLQSNLRYWINVVDKNDIHSFNHSTQGKCTLLQQDREDNIR